MTKILDASCVGGVVVAGDPPLPLAVDTILSEGVAASDGIAIIDGLKSRYITNVSADLSFGSVTQRSLRAIMRWTIAGQPTARCGNAQRH